MKLNLGCGNRILDGYDNIDLIQLDPSIKVMDVLDIHKHYSNNSIEHIYMRHLIEHLWYDDRIKLLYESIDLLEPTGILELLTPDFGLIVKAWTAGDLSITYLSKLIYGWYACTGSREKEKYMMHKIIYDRATMRDQLERIGFTKIIITTQEEAPADQPPLSMHVLATKP